MRETKSLSLSWAAASLLRLMFKSRLYVRERVKEREKDRERLRERAREQEREREREMSVCT